MHWRTIDKRIISYLESEKFDRWREVDYAMDEFLEKRKPKRSFYTMTGGRLIRIRDEKAGNRRNRVIRKLYVKERGEE